MHRSLLPYPNGINGISSHRGSQENSLDDGFVRNINGGYYKNMEYFDMNQYVEIKKIILTSQFWLYTFWQHWNISVWFHFTEDTSKNNRKHGVKGSLLLMVLRMSNFSLWYGSISRANFVPFSRSAKIVLINVPGVLHWEGNYQLIKQVFSQWVNLENTTTKNSQCQLRAKRTALILVIMYRAQIFLPIIP